MSRSGSLYVLIAVLAAGLILSSTLAAFYLLRYDQAENSASTYLGELKASAGTSGFAASTNILLDFGNGTQRWYNDTRVQPGWNVYLATVVITDGNLNDTWYPQYGEHLVNGIDGVQNTGSRSWFLFSYNSTSRWQATQLGADELPASNGSVYAWAYCGVSASYGPTCASP